MSMPLFYIDPNKAEKNIQFFKKVFQDLLTLKKNETMYVDCNGHLKKNHCWGLLWIIDFTQYFPYENERHVLNSVIDFLDEYFNILDDFYFASKLNKNVLKFVGLYNEFNEDLIKSLYIFLQNLSFKDHQILFQNKINECRHIFNIFLNKINDLK